MEAFRFVVKASIISEDNVNKFHTMATGVVVDNDEASAKKRLMETSPLKDEKLATIELIQITPLSLDSPGVTYF